MTEISRISDMLKQSGCDMIAGVGGGKIHDTAKAAGYYTGLPVLIVPTIASTDAPCSALSVIYTDEGVFEKYLFLPSSPNVVLVDTDIVSKAPARLWSPVWGMPLLHILKPGHVNSPMQITAWAESVPRRPWRWQNCAMIR